MSEEVEESPTPIIPEPTPQQIKCDKCGLFFLLDQVRQFHFSLRKKGTVTSPVDSVVLCHSCNALRRTTVTKYIES